MTRVFVTIAMLAYFGLVLVCHFQQPSTASAPIISPMPVYEPMPTSPHNCPECQDSGLCRSCYGRDHVVDHGEEWPCLHCAYTGICPQCAGEFASNED